MNTKMDTLDKMDALSAGYTKTDRAIFEKIRKFPEQFIGMNVNALAEETKFSQSALTRFAKKIGFTGFTEFQYQLGIDLEKRKQMPRKLRSEIYGSVIQEVEQAVNTAEIELLAERILSAPTVMTAGINLSKLPAEYLEMVLSYSVGSRSRFIHADSIPQSFSEGDVLIIFSVAGGSMLAKPLDSILNRAGMHPYIVLVTMNPKHPLRKKADEIIVLPSYRSSEATGAVLSETYSFLMFCDMLDTVLKTKR